MGDLSLLIVLGIILLFIFIALVKTMQIVPQRLPKSFLNKSAAHRRCQPMRRLWLKCQLTRLNRSMTSLLFLSHANQPLLRRKNRMLRSVVSRGRSLVSRMCSNRQARSMNRGIPATTGGVLAASCLPLALVRVTSFRTVSAIT